MIVHGFTATGTIKVLINDSVLYVPDDLSNRERQMIAEWEAEGNTIPPYVPPTPPEKPEVSPIEKLTQFLNANPDVVELLK